MSSLKEKLSIVSFEEKYILLTKLLRSTIKLVIDFGWSL